ncbi:unnamed protein product [Sphagnum jensenii]|uniref:Preprotein translocase subunit SecE n=1 Tax=Sphagnum jensenii TaxID=128206 RepID=A0ABP1C100_9BRYO
MEAHVISSVDVTTFPCASQCVIGSRASSVLHRGGMFCSSSSSSSSGSLFSNQQVLLHLRKPVAACNSQYGCHQFRLPWKNVQARGFSSLSSFSRGGAGDSLGVFRGGLEDDSVLLRSILVLPWSFGDQNKGRVRRRRRELVTKEASRLDRSLTSNNSYNEQEDALWLWVLKSFYSAMKGCLQFLWEQPGQLRHIQWTPLQSTIRMAMLTMVVVMLLIVFLATVDSAFSYLLARVLRRTP